MESEPIWFKYATFDEDGFVSGIRDDAPEDVKEAYRAYKEEERRYIDSGEPMPR